MAKKNAIAFIEELRTNAELRQKLAGIQEGDWNSVVKVAKEANFKFTESIDL